MTRCTCEEPDYRPPWRVRTSWASSPQQRLITVFKWKPDYHGTEIGRAHV